MRLSTEVSKLEERERRLAEENLELQQKLARARPPGNVVLVTRQGFSRAMTIRTDHCYGAPYSIYMLAEHRDFAMPTRACSPSDVAQQKTFRATGQRDFWGREIMEEI